MADSVSPLWTLATELFTSPLNVILIAICCYLIYKIITSRQTPPKGPVAPEYKPLKKRDFTLEQLREFDGKSEDGRVLVGVNGKVFDVTRGKHFYGPNGPYGVFAGRDASRGLATFSVQGDAIREEHDDLSDLSEMQLESMREWEMQFTEKYDIVGKLLKPGEKPTEYSDTEEEPSAGQESESSPAKNKDE